MKGQAYSIYVGEGGISVLLTSIFNQSDTGHTVHIDVEVNNFCIFYEVILL